MEITLSPGLQRFVEEKVASGEYASVSDVIAGALMLLREEDAPLWTDEELRKEIQIGLDQLDRGETAEFTADDIKAEGRRLLAAEQAAARSQKAG
jgi:antitoxin ParD1/3/4